MPAYRPSAWFGCRLAPGHEGKHVDRLGRKFPRVPVTCAACKGSGVTYPTAGN